MEVLERTQSWKEEEFDVVLQFMRAILLRRKETLLEHCLTVMLTAVQMVPR